MVVLLGGTRSHLTGSTWTPALRLGVHIGQFWLRAMPQFVSSAYLSVPIAQSFCNQDGP